MSTPLLGVSLQPRWPVEDGTAVLRAASHAEDLGFGHVAVGNRLLDSGSGLDTDPLVLLAAVAAATERLRLLTSVLVAPYYPALMLANQAATLDVVSGGRLILGVGTGWNPQEFAAVGVPAHVARRYGSAATATPPCAGRCASAMAGTEPASAPLSSPTSDAACVNLPTTPAMPSASPSAPPHSSPRRASPQRCRHRGGRSAAPRPQRRASSMTSGTWPRRGSPPARCGCRSRLNAWRRRWSGSQPRSCRSSPDAEQVPAVPLSGARACWSRSARCEARAGAARRSNGPFDTAVSSLTLVFSGRRRPREETASQAAAGARTTGPRCPTRPWGRSG
jgi:hypothetical protein